MVSEVLLFEVQDESKLADGKYLHQQIFNRHSNQTHFEFISYGIYVFDINFCLPTFEKIECN